MLYTLRNKIQRNATLCSMNNMQKEKYNKNDILM